MKIKKIISATTIALGMTVATQANAIQWLFDEIGDTFTANYAYTQDGAAIDADITFTLDSWSANSATFTVDIDNTLTSGPGTNRIVAFGIDVIAPALTSSSDTSADWGTTLVTNFPGFQTVDLCAWAGANCAGGSNDGVFEGTSDSFGLTLNTAGNFLTNGITFTSPFATKWQSVGTQGGSYEWDTTSSSTSGSTTSSTTSGSTTSSTGGTEISEPGILALLGIGLLGQAFLLISRRRRLGL